MSGNTFNLHQSSKNPTFRSWNHPAFILAVAQFPCFNKTSPFSPRFSWEWSFLVARGHYPGNGPFLFQKVALIGIRQLFGSKEVPLIAAEALFRQRKGRLIGIRGS